MSIDSVEALLAALRSGEDLDDGEPVDLLAHALQCARLLATARPDDTEVQVAGLVHDLGSILEPDAPATHALTGAAAVEGLLGPRIAALVAGHDQAKRYLVTVDPEYRAQLSPTSIATLRHQGGPMDTDELARFEAAADYDALVALRRADDGAKVPDVDVGALEDWRTLVRAVATP